MVADRIHVLLISCYLGLAGIYWFPGVPHTLLSQFKLSLVGMLGLVGALRLQRAPYVQTSFIASLGLCAVVAFIANAISTNAEAGIDRARDFIEPMALVIALSGLKPRAYPLFVKTLAVTMTIFTVVALYPVGVAVGLLPNINAPEAFLDPTGLNTSYSKEWLIEQSSVRGGGWAGQRTTWGAILPAAALLTAALYMGGAVSARYAIPLAAVAIAGSLASVAVTSARGGTLALVAVTAYGIIAARGRLISGLVLLGVVSTFGIAFDVTSMLPEDFFRNFDAQGDAFSIMNSASTGRMETYVAALEHFAASPIVGVGLDGARIWLSSGEHVQVHNTWLKLLAESGAMLFLPLLIPLSRIVSLAFRNRGLPMEDNCAMALPDTRLVILSGMLTSLAEPNGVFGTLNASAYFWTGLWMALVATSARKPFSASPPRRPAFAVAPNELPLQRMR